MGCIFALTVLGMRARGRSSGKTISASTSGYTTNMIKWTLMALKDLVQGQIAGTLV